MFHAYFCGLGLHLIFELNCTIKAITSTFFDTIIDIKNNFFPKKDVYYDKFEYYFFICIAFVLFLTLLLTYLISIQIFMTILKKRLCVN